MKTKKKKVVVENVVEPVPFKRFRTYKTKILEKYFPKKLVLVEMYNYNGTIAYFTVLTDKHKFSYSGGIYLVDEQRKLWNTSAKMFMLRYHEGFALPYEIDLSASEMKIKGGENSPEVATSFNPGVLKDVLKFEYARGVIQGAEVHEYIKRSFFILIMIGLIALVHLIANAYINKWF